MVERGKKLIFSKKCIKTCPNMWERVIMGFYDVYIASRGFYLEKISAGSCAPVRIKIVIII